MPRSEAKKIVLPRLHMHLALPYPPSANSLYIPSRGRMVLSKGHRKYREDVEKVLEQLGHPGTSEGLIEADIWLCPPDRRGRDIDNVLKALFDALQKAKVYNNDFQVKRLTSVTMDYWPYPDGAVIVKLTEIPAHDFEREGNGDLLDALRDARVALGMPVKPPIPRPAPVYDKRVKQPKNPKNKAKYA